MRAYAILATILSTATAKWWLQGNSIDMKPANGVVDAIRKGARSRYDLKIQYGSNSIWWSKYAYIFTEVSGDRIEDQAVVATYVKLEDVDYTYKVGNFTQYHTSLGDVEMAECRV